MEIKYKNELKYFNELFFKFIDNDYINNNLNENNFLNLINALITINSNFLNRKDFELLNKNNYENIKLKKFKNKLSKLNFEFEKEIDYGDSYSHINAENYFEYFKTPSIVKKLKLNNCSESTNYEDNNKRFCFEKDIELDSNFFNHE